MAKRPQTKKQQFRKESHARFDPLVATPDTGYIPNMMRAPLAPKNDAQKRYMNAINAFDVVFAVGPAGTGKTYLPVAMAADALASKKINKIIITRPAEAAEDLGFLPGDLDEKYAPYLAPVLQVLNERLGKSRVEYELKSGKIEPIPLAFMRGLTFNDAYIILDEAQNVTPHLMKMFLTRIGENCKVIICGDTDQIDISGQSGLDDAIKRCSWIPQIKVIEFGPEDIVRSGLVQDIVSSYGNRAHLGER